jgi:hypothetical protein
MAKRNLIHLEDSMETKASYITGGGAPQTLTFDARSPGVSLTAAAPVPPIPQTIVHQGRTYRRAGIVVDGIVYLGEDLTTSDLLEYKP